MRNLSNILERPAASYPVHPFFILEKNSAISFFEPLILVQKMGLVGLEVVSRAVDPDHGNLIDPRDLYRNMTKEDSGLKLPLDQLFRQKGLEGFFPIQSRRPGLLLFLGVNPSVLHEEVVGSGYLLRQARELKLDPRQIVVQISLAEPMNELMVRKFLEYQRINGFLTALKDLTPDPNHLDALYRFNPDMVQAADSWIKGISGNIEQQKAFRRLVRAAHSEGVLVAAGGVQSEEDGLVALEIGADLLQGKYLSKSYENNLVFTLSRKARMGFLSARYRRRVTNRAKRDRELMENCKGTAESIFTRLENPPVLEMEKQFTTIFADHPSLECLYLLDGEGVQVSEAICSQYHIPERKKLLFKSSPKGADHSLREYYYALSQGEERHLTDPYLSMNSGNLCVTASQKVSGSGEDALILCVDLNVSKF
jgi:EAL domain-containing protein (putative c-di-GMP-specific phosphodiesterase class I)